MRRSILTVACVLGVVQGACSPLRQSLGIIAAGSSTTGASGSAAGSTGAAGASGTGVLTGNQIPSLPPEWTGCDPTVYRCFQDPALSLSSPASGLFGGTPDPDPTMKPAIVILGSLNMDFVVRVPHLPIPGETVLGHGFETLPGGKGANQACAAGRAGAETVAVKMLGRVGYDVFGDQLKASLAASGVDVSGVHATQEQPTGVALIWVDKAGQNSIVVASGANHSLGGHDIDCLPDSVFQAGDVLLAGLEVPVKTAARAIERSNLCHTRR